MNLYINGQATCSSDAVYGDRGDNGMGAHGGHKLKSRQTKSDNKFLTIASMTDCEGPFKVKKGDYIQIESVYDLGKHPL
jgi:hypothetical protein